LVPQNSAGRRLASRTTRSLRWGADRPTDPIGDSRRGHPEGKLTQATANKGTACDPPDDGTANEQRDSGHQDRYHEALRAGEVRDQWDDPSLHPGLQVDERELEEVGAELDDPKGLVTLDGGIDDPDGRYDPPLSVRYQREDNGWDLDAPIAAGDVSGRETAD
jgi:hypothetical protein